ncbi:hypothetical protein ACFE04_029718 [Oxalis oulophora]
MEISLFSSHFIPLRVTSPLSSLPSIASIPSSRKTLSLSRSGHILKERIRGLLSRPSLIAFIFQALSIPLPAQMRQSAYWYPFPLKNDSFKIKLTIMSVCEMILVTNELVWTSQSEIVSAPSQSLVNNSTLFSSQMILYDTPGVIEKKIHKLDTMMIKNVRSAAVNVDCVIILVDASKMLEKIDEVLEEGVGDQKYKVPTLLVMNKKDLIKPGEITLKFQTKVGIPECDWEQRQFVPINKLEKDKEITQVEKNVYAIHTRHSIFRTPEEFSSGYVPGANNIVTCQ